LSLRREDPERAGLGKIRVNKAAKKRSYTVRWAVAGCEKSKNFTTRALADNYRSDLMQAINRGAAFDADSGLPDSMTTAKDVTTWLEFAESYVTMKWPGAAAKSRNSMIEALATVTPVLVRDLAGRPDIEAQRVALRDWLLLPAVRQTRSAVRDGAGDPMAAACITPAERSDGGVDHSRRA
jgi:hypothetical protein